MRQECKFLSGYSRNNAEILDLHSGETTAHQFRLELARYGFCKRRSIEYDRPAENKDAYFALRLRFDKWAFDPESKRVEPVNIVSVVRSTLLAHHPSTAVWGAREHVVGMLPVPYDRSRPSLLRCR